jgi:hypothetical protein
MYMNPFEMAGYVALGFVPTLVEMKIGWYLAKKKLLVSCLERDEIYETTEPVTLTAKTGPSPHKL